MNARSDSINFEKHIEVRDISFSYPNSAEILKTLNFELSPGETLALIGPNGAGKSTLLSLLQGARKPNQGEIKIMGCSPRWSKIRSMVGVVTQEVDFPAQISPREAMQFAVAHFSNSHQIEEIVEKFDLTKLVDRRFSGFSVGEQRRVAIALAFVGNPKLIYLDEPTAGLDSTGQDRLFENIKEFQSNGGSLVLTSHVWNDIETLADRILVLDNGRIILSGTIKEIGNRLEIRNVSFRLENGSEPPTWISESFKFTGEFWTSSVKNSDEIVKRLCSEDIPFSNLRIETLGLRAAIETLFEEDEESQ